MTQIKIKILYTSADFAVKGLRLVFFSQRSAMDQENPLQKAPKRNPIPKTDLEIKQAPLPPNGPEE